MLYLIGCGLGDVKDLTLNGINALNNCDFIYIENYTSLVGFSISDLKNILDNKDKHIEVVDRTFVETADKLLTDSKNKNTALLIKGDVFSATTHVDLFLRAKAENIPIKVLHNSSILTAIGDTGLSLYKFGRVASIPFNNKNVNSPFDIYLMNKSCHMHTLFVLDLDPINNKFMNFKEGLLYLNEHSDGSINFDTYVIICASLGTNKAVIKYGKIEELLKIEIDIYPQCLIIPSELHFMEEEMLKLF